MEKPVAFIIEDDEDLSTVFTEAVKAAGFASETFLAGDLALERLANFAPQIIVLDLHLPGVTGDKILDYIESQPHLEKVNVIVASADDRLAQQVHGRPTLTLLKPISFGQLRDLVTRFLPPQSQQAE